MIARVLGGKMLARILVLVALGFGLLALQRERRQLEPIAGGRDRGMPACGGGAGRKEVSRTQR